jgi:hypothetical protein
MKPNLFDRMAPQMTPLPPQWVVLLVEFLRTRLDAKIEEDPRF